MSILTTLENLPAPVNAALRHVYTGLGVATITLVAVGLSQGDATALGNAVHQIGDGVASIAAGISAIVAIVSPLYASWTATRASRIASVAADPKVSTVIVSDPKLAASIPADNVKVVSLVTQAAVDSTAAPAKN